MSAKGTVKKITPHCSLKVMVSFTDVDRVIIIVIIIII